MELICRFYVQGEQVDEFRAPSNAKNFDKAYSMKEKLVAKYRKEYPEVMSDRLINGFSETCLYDPLKHKVIMIHMDYRYNTHLKDCLGNDIWIGDCLLSKDIFDKVKDRKRTADAIAKNLMVVHDSCGNGPFLHAIHGFGIPDVGNLTQEDMSGCIRVDMDKAEAFSGDKINKIILKN